MSVEIVRPPDVISSAHAGTETIVAAARREVRNNFRVFIFLVFGFSCVQMVSCTDAKTPPEPGFGAQARRISPQFLAGIGVICLLVRAIFLSENFLKS